jgi:membrane protease YdiL (CAAX protease family)
MAQNDLIKEIVFIADEQYEAPAFAWGIALAYLLALVVAELLAAFVSPLVGMILYGLILIALLVQSSIGAKKRMHDFLVVLSIVPLIRLLAMTVPLANFEPIYWYLLVGILLSVLVFIIARLTGLSPGSIGLRITLKELPLQLLIGLTGLGIGLIGYMILRPDPYLPNFSWGKFLLAGLVLLVFAGLLQEIIFRGLLQISTTQILGRFGILYVALLFALLQLGFSSFWYFLFTLLVGLVFGVIAAQTHSLVGVSISHGLANVSLLLILPMIMTEPAARIDPPLPVSVPIINTPTHTSQASPTRTPTSQVSPTGTNELVEPQPLVLVPITGRTATSTPPAEDQAACDSHPNWVVYVTQQGDTIHSISVMYGIDTAELRAANCFEDNHQIKGGQGLFVPFDLIHSPTPSPRVLFSALNPPTATPTKKPTRKPTATPTSRPVKENTPIPTIPTATPLPPTPTPHDLPTLAPTQMPPPPPPTQEN